MLARQSTDVSGEAGFRHGSLDLNKPVLRRPLSRSRCIDTSSRADDQVAGPVAADIDGARNPIGAASF